MAAPRGISFVPSVAALNFLIRFTAITRGITGGLNRAQKDALAQIRRGEIAARAVTLGISVPLAALSGIATAVAVSFEDAFSGVEKTVAGTDAQLNKLRRTLERLSTEIPVSFEDLALIAELGGQFQVPINKLEDFTQAVARLVATTRLTIEGASTAIARLVQAFPEDDLFKLTSALIDAGDITVGTEQELIDISKRIAESAKRLGFTAADVLAFASAVRSAGGNVESSATNLVKFFDTLVITVAIGGEKLRALNNLFTQFGRNTEKSFEQAFKENRAQAILTLIARLTELQKVAKKDTETLLLLRQTIVQVFGSSKRLSKVIDDLTKSVDAAGTSFLSLEERRRILTESFNRGISVFEKSEKKFRSAASVLLKLKNTFLLLSASVGQIFLKAIKAIAPVIESFIRTGITLANLLEKIPTNVSVLVTVLLGLLVILPPLAVAITQLGAAAVLLNTSLISLFLSSLAISGVLLLVVGSFTLLVVAISEAKHTFKDFGSFITFILVKILEAILEIPLVIGNAISGIISLVELAVGGVLKLVETIAQALPFPLMLLGRALGFVGDKLIDNALSESKALKFLQKKTIEYQQQLEDYIVDNLIAAESNESLADSFTAIVDSASNAMSTLEGFSTGTNTIAEVMASFAEELTKIQFKQEVLGDSFDAATAKAQAARQALEKLADVFVKTGVRDEDFEKQLTDIIQKAQKSTDAVETLTGSLENLGNFLERTRAREAITPDLSGISSFSNIRTRINRFISLLVEEADRQTRQLGKTVSPESILLSDPRAREAVAQMKSELISLIPLRDQLNKAASIQDPIESLERQIKLLKDYKVLAAGLQNILGLSSKELETLSSQIDFLVSSLQTSLNEIKEDNALAETVKQFREEIAKASRATTFEQAVFGTGDIGQLVSNRIDRVKQLITSMAEENVSAIEATRTELSRLISEFNRLSIAQKRIDAISKAFDLAKQSINSSISSSVDGVLRGTITIRDMWIKLTEDLIVSFISAMARLLVEFIVTQAKMLAIQFATSRGLLGIKQEELVEYSAVEKLKTLLSSEEGATRVLAALGESTAKSAAKAGEGATWAAVEGEKTAAESTGALARIGITLKELGISMAQKVAEGATWVGVELQKLAATTATMAVSIAQILLAAAGMTILALASSLAAAAFVVLSVATVAFGIAISVLAALLAALLPVLVVEFAILGGIFTAVAATMSAVVAAFVALVTLIAGLAGLLLVAAQAAAKLAIALAASSVAGIPIIGAVLAPIAAAATGAAITAAASGLRFARGGIVPGIGPTDSVPAMLTPGEMVLPPDLSDGLRNMVTEGQQPINVTIHTIDSDGVRKFVSRNKNRFARAVRQEVRNFNPDVFGG